MKILLVSEPGLNGVFRHVEALAEFLLAKGIEVGLAYSSIRSSDRLHCLVKRLQSAGQPTLDLRVANSPSFADGPALFELLRLVNRWNPDVLHAHSSKAGVLARSLRIFGVKTPIFYTPHAYYAMAPHARNSAFFKRIERCFGAIGTTVNLSEDEALYARKELAVPFASQRLIANGVDQNTFRPATEEEKKVWRGARGLPLHAVILGTVGRYTKQKDPITLYRALKPLLTNESNFWFAHLGEGELYDECARLCQSGGFAHKVISIKYESTPAGFYRALDGFVLSSTYEGHSLSALEALATDLPLILSDAPGNRGFRNLGLSHLETAAVGDAGSFRRAIQRWLSDLEILRGSNHRLVAETSFGLDACFGKLFGEYQRSLARSDQSVRPRGLRGLRKLVGR